MTRMMLVAAGLGVGACPVFADLPVAPPPREVRPDGSRDPVPAADPAEDPAAVVGRIVANSKAVGEKLAAADTGTGTRSTQGTILRDIDALLNRQPDDPPPQGGDGADDQPKSDQKKDQPGGKGEPKGGPPKDGQQQAKGKGGRKPRSQGGEPKPGDERSAAAGGKKEPMPGGDPKDGKDPAGVAATAGGNPDGKPTRATRPLDDEVTKEVWGHLPDKLRQQVTQYYKEQYMPRYADLLKQYYSSLATPTNRPAGEMRK